MVEKEVDFLQEHSLRFLEMAFRTDRRERVHQPDGYGRRTGGCGDTVEFFLMIESGRISHVSYDMDGCMNTNACANAAAEMIEGKTPEEAWNLTPEDLIASLETLPHQSHHCAELAVGALYMALSDAAGRSGNRDRAVSTAP